MKKGQKLIQIFMIMIFLQSCASTSFDCKKNIEVDSILLRSRAIIDGVKSSRTFSKNIKRLKSNKIFLEEEKNLYQKLDQIILNNEKIKRVLNPRYKLRSMALHDCDEDKNQKVSKLNHAISTKKLVYNFLTIPD